jgi:glycine oxidase
VLVGATMERVGFDKRVTADAVKSLLGAALRLWPALERAQHTRSWAGLRPFAEGDDPVCAATELPGLVVATGHGRNGILLAPLAAERIAALVAS